MFSFRYVLTWIFHYQNSYADVELNKWITSMQKKTVCRRQKLQLTIANNNKKADDFSDIQIFLRCKNYLIYVLTSHANKTIFLIIFRTITSKCSEIKCLWTCFLKGIYLIRTEFQIEILVIYWIWKISCFCFFSNEKFLQSIE